MTNLPSSLSRSIVVGLALLHAACTSSPRLVLPQGPGRPLSDYAAVLGRAIDPCVGVRTMQFVLSINGQSGGTRLGGRVLGALARPSSLRLEGIAPFGAPVFVLAATPEGAVLVVPRDRTVVTGASGSELLAALTGLGLAPDDFRAVLTGCILTDPQGVGGRLYDDDWMVIDLNEGGIVYLRTVDGAPGVVAGARPGMVMEYSDHVRGLPRRVYVRATDGGGVVTELTATLSDVSINIDLHPDVFVAPVRPDYQPMTLQQFRGTAGPLEVSPEPTHSPDP